jgi:catechol 2,3-dioxygenase-like lactoylglutathione lyase family enzyme
MNKINFRSAAAFILTLSFVLSLSSVAFAQDITKPRIWGIAKMTFLVSDFKLARDYYGKFLGFDEAFSYNSDPGKVISFKVNDRQFLEFIEDKDARQKTRLVSVSFETDNVEQMRGFLKTKGVEVPEKVNIDGAGNEVVLVHDPSGIPIEFIKLNPDSPHRQSKGKFLSANRISKRIHHAGLYCKEVLDNDPFYVGILGFKEFWRYPEDQNEKAQMNYLQIPDCTENVEHYSPNEVNFSHPCLLVDDMQEAIYILKERMGKNALPRPVLGKGRRWILNLQNEDRTKIELTEAHVVK